MTIDRHPDPATLITCAAGSQPEALCAVVASHISICRDCQGEFQRMEKIGVALFEELEPQALENACPHKPDADAAPGSHSSGHSAPRVGEVPDTIREVVGDSLDDLDWKRLRDGVDHFVIELSPNARGDLRLVRLSPGASLPTHGHCGEELTLVLRGAYHDETGVFAVGDFSDLDDDTRHTVVADGQSGCILLIASEDRPQFLTG